MKKLIFLLFILNFHIVFSQKVIIDEKYQKNDFPIGFSFLAKSNKLIIKRGKNYGISTNGNTNSMYEYDSEGNKKIVLDNVNLMGIQYSDTENTFKASEYSKLRGNYQYNFYNDKKVSPLFQRKDYDDYSSQQILDDNFNDKYLIFLSNEKGKDNLDLNKREVYVEIIELFTQKKKRIKIDNFNKERLLQDGNIKYENELGFSLRIIDNENFEIVTKSISKDYKSTVLYRTIYDFDGNFIKDLSYKIDIKDGFLIYSNSNATYLRPGKHDPNVNIFANDLAINNFKVDKDNNVYVYGLLGKEGTDLNDRNEVYGFYVFKFDKEGNKIWEYAISDIDDPKFLNKKFSLHLLYSSLYITGNTVIFNVGTDFWKEFYYYYVLDTKNGNVIKSNKILFDDKKMSMTKYTFSFIPEFYKLPTSPNILTNKNGLIASDYDVNIQNFIKSLEGNLNIHILFSEDGKWVIESDNETYYKVYYFDGK